MIEMSLKQAAAALQPELVALRRQLHAHPELAFEETWTAALMAERMRALGMKVETGIGGTGVLAILEGVTPGRTVMLRCDMDGVDQTEAPGKAYGSTIAGRNHSCGHDINMTMNLGAAELLGARRDEIKGTLAFVFQPADEPMAGARRMFADGLWDRVSPDAVLGLHIAADLAAGEVVANSGAVWASLDTFRVSLSRAASPALATHLTLAAAQLVSLLYGAVASETTVIQPATFSATAIDAIHQRGVPLTASIGLRLETFDNAQRGRLLDRIDTLCRSYAAACDAVVSIERGTDIPAIINDRAVAAIVGRMARQIIGEEAVVYHRHSVWDDFSLFLEKAPGAMVLFGTANASKGITANWHTPEYDCDEDVLHLGAAVMAESALRLLEG